jgi:hypothetical protein
VINNITLSEWNARELIDQLQPVSGRAAVLQWRYPRGIGEDYDATLTVIKMFAGTGEFYPALIGMVRAIFGTLRTYTVD